MVKQPLGPYCSHFAANALGPVQIRDRDPETKSTSSINLASTGKRLRMHDVLEEFVTGVVGF